MSKKQLQHLRTAAGLLACSLLLCFPGGIPLLPSFPVLKALISGLLALGLAHSLLKLGTLPACLRIGVLFPVAFSAGLILLALPHLLIELWLLLPFALILLILRPRFPSLNPPWFFSTLWLCLSLGSLGFLETLTRQVNQGLPLLPSHINLWLCILAVIPLGFASRPRLRPLAKAIARYQIWIGLLLLGLYPLIWCTATSFKIPGEAYRNFHQLSPQPRFFLLPKEGIPDLTPSELRNNPLEKEILFTLNEMTWRLTDRFIASTFPKDGTLAPEEMLQAMKVYGFLHEDRHGGFLPGESFVRDAPEEMAPQYLKDFRESMRQTLLSPAEIVSPLRIEMDTAYAVFKNLQDLNWVREVPGNALHYRLTPQARRPFENGLYPRQLLYLEQAKPGLAVEMAANEYVPRRKLSPSQILNEFTTLQELGAAETRPVRQWNQHRDFLLQSARWKKTGLLTLTAILALLIGRCLSDRLSKPVFSLLILTGILVCLQFPYVLPFQPALRIGLGLWIARNLFSLKDSECDRISLFAACGFISSSLMPLAGEAALVHQCAWILIWTLPAVLFLAFAVRPLKREER